MSESSVQEEMLKELEIFKKDTLSKIVESSMIFFLHCHVSTSGHKMSFKFMPYLKKMYFDESPKLAIMSSVQTGKSEFLLIKGLASVGLGLNVFHVFSTGEAKNSFVKSRINELCDKVPTYQAMEQDDRRNMYLRHMGKANWKFVISNSKSHFDEFPADVVIVDELDSCNQENVKLSGTRLENSNYKFEWLVGNPSVTNTGISQEFEKSTKNEWQFKCAECGKFFMADFFKCVVYEIRDKDGNHLSYELHDKDWTEDSDRDIHVRCRHCKTLQSRGKGRWLVCNPGARISGYHISKLMKLNSKVSELWEELKEAEGNEFKMMIFYNKKLGLPYSGTGSKVTSDMLDKITYNYQTKGSSEKATIAGMDVGSKFDIEIDISAKHEGKRKRLMLNALRLNSIDEVKEIIGLYNIKTMCVGLKPERHLMQTFRKDMFGICNIILIEELEGRSGNLKLLGWKENEDEGVITVDRTWLLDEAMKNIKFKTDIIPKDYMSMLGGYWYKSMSSITRVYQNDKEEYKWSKADHDHFRFAGAFAMLAFMKTQDAVLIGDDFKKTEEKESDENGNRILKPMTKFRQDSIGLIKRRFGIGRTIKGLKKRVRAEDEQDN